MNVYKGVKLDIFTVVADPTRRLILDSLREQDKSVQELADLVNIKQSGVSRHLAILAKIGLVVSQKSAQKHIYSLRGEPLQELDNWLEQYRTIWNSRFNKLEKHLNAKKGNSNDK